VSLETKARPAPARSRTSRSASLIFVISACGGHGLRAHPGDSQKARALHRPIAKIILSYISLTRTPRRTPPGPDGDSPARRNGRRQPAAAWTRRRTPGATSRRPPISGWPTTGTGTFRGGPPRATGRHPSSAPSPPIPTDSLTWPEMSGSGPRTGTEPGTYGTRHEGEVDVAPCCAPRNPRGPEVEASYDPRQPQFPVPRKVIKGGSFLCADSYCLRYRPTARRPQMIDTGMSHIGFRCVKRT
jgi:hypothetical protein